MASGVDADLPFELRMLEAALDCAGACLAAEVAALERHAGPLLDDIVKQVGPPATHPVSWASYAAPHPLGLLVGSAFILPTSLAEGFCWGSGAAGRARAAAGSAHEPDKAPGTRRAPQGGMER